MTAEQPIPTRDLPFEDRIKILLVQMAREQFNRNPDDGPDSPRHVNLYDRMEQLFDLLDLHGEALVILLEMAGNLKKSPRS